MTSRGEALLAKLQTTLDALATDIAIRHGLRPPLPVKNPDAATERRS